MRKIAWSFAILVACACTMPEKSAPPVAPAEPIAPAAPRSEPVATAEANPPKPEPASRVEPPPPVDPGTANLDPTDDYVVGPPDPIADCDERLKAAGVQYRPGAIPVKPTRAGNSCGAPQIVIYEVGPTGIKWNAQPVVTCQLALGLAHFESLLQEEAQRLLGAKVVRIHQGGTYSCRKMARFDWVSEHSYANAIDLRGFELSDHRVLSVKRYFGRLETEPDKPESRFLRTVARRAFSENVFSVVLTPFWDKLHEDHFHVDQARYHVGSVNYSPHGA